MWLDWSIDHLFNQKHDSQKNELGAGGPEPLRSSVGTASGVVWCGRFAIRIDDPRAILTMSTEPIPLVVALVVNTPFVLGELDALEGLGVEAPGALFTTAGTTLDVVGLEYRSFAWTTRKQ